MSSTYDRCVTQTKREGVFTNPPLALLGLTMPSGSHLVWFKGGRGESLRCASICRSPLSV